MDKQIKYLLGVLILLLISAYFLSLLSGLPQYFKDDIIAFLEERFKGEISFSSVSLWPLNRIRLNKFEFTSESGSSFKADALNLDYSLNFREDEIIQVEFIELLGAEIEVQSEFLNLNQNSSGTQNFRAVLNQDDFLRGLNLPDFLEDLRVNIRDSSLSLNTETLDLKLNDLQLGLAAKAGDVYDLNVSTALDLRQLKLSSGQSLNDINLSKVDLQFVRESSAASIYFNAQDLKLPEVVENLPLSSIDYQGLEIDLKTLSGLSSVRGELNFKDYGLQNYQSQLDLKNLELQSSYSSQSEQKESISLSAPALNIKISGPELSLAVIKNKIFWDQNPLDLSFKWNQNKDYKLKLRGKDFNYNYKFLTPYLETARLNFDFQLTAKENQIQSAAAEISASELRGDYLDLKQIELSAILDQKELFINRAKFLLNDQNQLDLRGSYNLAEKNYLLSAEAENFILTEDIMSGLNQIDYLRDGNYLNQIDKIKDRHLDFKINTAGIYNGIDELSTNGDLSLAFKSAAYGADFKIDSSFWYTDNRLFLNSLKLISDYGRLDLMGELDLDSQTMQLRYAARNLEPELLNEFLAEDLTVLSGLNTDLDFLEGSITNSFASPTVNIRLKMAELKYEDYLLDDLSLSAIYENDNLQINDFQAKIAQAAISASGELRHLSQLEEAELDLQLNSQNLYFQDIADFSSQNIPLSGEIQLQAALSGRLTDYDLNLQLAAASSILQLDGQEIEFSKLQAEIIRTNGDFVVKTLTAEQQNLQLSAGGSFNFKEGFDINLNISGFEPANYLSNYQFAAGKVEGSLSLKGKLRGEMDKAVFNFELDSENLSFANFNLELGDNSLTYRISENKVLVDQFNFTAGSGRYNINGQILDINSQPKSDLKIELLEIPARELTFKFVDFYPLASDLIFKGNIDFKSTGLDYQAQLDLRANSESGQGNLSLAGTVDDDFALEFKGSDVEVDFNSRQYDFNLNLKSLVDFSGSVEGSLKSPVVRVSHNLRELTVNNNPVEVVEGEILLESNRRFSVSESINYKSGGSLKLDGSYSMIDHQLNLSTNLESLPLGFLISFLGEDYSASGRINGSFRAEGSLESPALSGNLDLVAERLNLGLTDPIEDLSAKINLRDGSAVIESLNGSFADGNFRVSGDLNLLEQENAWDLNFSGQKLYFEYGSLAGDFDAELIFKGPLFNPVLAGDLLAYDFKIGIPFKWPASESEPGAFVPKINIDIRPGENVTVENENMEVMVQSGSLNLQFDSSLEESLAMEGRLRSEEGNFTYYNSRFKLENAEAVFTPVDENDIPSLSVNAITYAGGHEININLNGPANNMRISLSSDSDLTEEEILNLLSTRGALGSAIIGGEDIGIQNIIWQELMRVVNSFLQRGVISDLESDFETIFSLDRAEIDAFQYGLEREFAIYLGKNITDKLYLEYASFFNEEGRRGEISFQYKLTDPTVLKGTYFGDNEYQISIETEIEF
ncbi:translocation/assembly module TamB domain-containing protein [Halanaerobium kushneri]|uniref:Translocation and assembly module TamB n=1 Tax=Halanaerobium kushneri TaxID=56779 RepID=A0A1N6T011_9FIRM|nr:translocation/assembly module TamB domain-containing protein [Halanaerobium kushneri]SIQ46446.1 translocation and assembly module TamB [Halanaerobium kushneri]